MMQSTLLDAPCVVPQRKLLSLQKSDVILETHLKIISSLIETDDPIGCVDLTTVEPIADLAQFQKSTANFETNQFSEADPVLDLVCVALQHSALTEQPPQLHSQLSLIDKDAMIDTLSTEIK